MITVFAADSVAISRTVAMAITEAIDAKGEEVKILPGPYWDALNRVLDVECEQKTQEAEGTLFRGKTLDGDSWEILLGNPPEQMRKRKMSIFDDNRIYITDLLDRFSTLKSLKDELEEAKEVYASTPFQDLSYTSAEERLAEAEENFDEDDSNELYAINAVLDQIGKYQGDYVLINKKFFVDYVRAEWVNHLSDSVSDGIASMLASHINWQTLSHSVRQDYREIQAGPKTVFLLRK